MEDSIMADPEDFLVTRRSRRSTAGNRMEAALAEMALDATSKDIEDDIDFVNDKDEEDVFGSDFESTDEEGAQGETETGDKDVQEEERRARRVARLRAEKFTAAAHARHKATFNPQTQASATHSQPQQPKRRVSLGMAVNAETGEILTPEKGSSNRKKRHSQRRHTILNTSATVKRMKRSEEKKAAAPKKNKTESRAFTQAELIARALDNEEGNIVEHRDYLKIEEEKRKRARVVRAAVEGPLLRWVSRGEEVKAIVESPPPPVPLPPRLGYSYSYGAAFTSTTYGSGSNSYSAATAVSLSTLNASSPSKTQASQRPPQQQQTHFLPTNYISYSPQVVNSTGMLQAVSSGPQRTERIEKVAKNYVVHELSQFDDVPKPPWNQTMTAMFGDHVKWDELRVYVGKGRPLSRHRQICPITGKQAKYLDPRTGVPYADARAYEVLTSILRHEYIWSQSLECYVGLEQSSGGV